jgi:hypothetical protein
MIKPPSQLRNGENYLPIGPCSGAARPRRQSEPHSARLLEHAVF